MPHDSVATSYMAGNPQGNPLREQVWDDGKSERYAVMAWIGIQDLSHAKAGRLPSGKIVVKRLHRLITLRRDAAHPFGERLRPRQASIDEVQQ